MQADLFKSFQAIRYIGLQNYDVRNFFHSIGIEWMLELNAGVTPVKDFNTSTANIEYINGVFVTVMTENFASPLIESTYVYGDEDFCLFYKFPHEKLVFMVLDDGGISTCTCTIWWLLQHSSFYYAMPSLTFDPRAAYNTCIASEPEGFFEKCRSFMKSETPKCEGFISLT
jgi:hypothetical protein